MIHGSVTIQSITDILLLVNLAGWRMKYLDSFSYLLSRRIQSVQIENLQM